MKPRNPTYWRWFLLNQVLRTPFYDKMIWLNKSCGWNSGKGLSSLIPYLWFLVVIILSELFLRPMFSHHLLNIFHEMPFNEFLYWCSVNCLFILFYFLYDNVHILQIRSWINRSWTSVKWFHLLCEEKIETGICHTFCYYSLVPEFVTLKFVLFNDT